MNEGPDIHIVPGRRRHRIPPLRRGVYVLPNLFTSAGLFAGFYSIIATLGHQYRIAAIMILVAQLCDSLDGRIARLTRSSSGFGVQYDSLADLVAFGVAPGILVYQWALRPWGRWGWLAASLYVTCGALRLARFNVQIGTVEKRHFVGLPIPAAADVIAATVLLFYRFGFEGDTTKHISMLLVIYAVAALMVSEIRYFSFKEIRVHQRHPFQTLLGCILVLMLTIGDPMPMLFLGSMTYALSGPVGLALRTLDHRRRRGASPPPPASVHPVVLDKPAPRR
ncbi:MAG TPA: CDP-diacylglycerol--serine O-phosphatidyltransferase [Candidatus Binatia bacterium]|nr:CDP-diacylglycerol--serine O-phosphatidyltransferase [Candidatus Binatia bacterium]